MKKFIALLPIMFFLFSGYAHSEQDEESVEICTKEAAQDNVPADKAKEYIDKCVQGIADDEKREQEESKKSS